jgi:hypothetical protein
MVMSAPRKRFPLLLFGYIALAIGFGALLMDAWGVAVAFCSVGAVLCGASLIRDHWYRD